MNEHKPMAASLPRGDVEGLMDLVIDYGSVCVVEGPDGSEAKKDAALNAIERALASRLAAPASIPDGYVLVPKEPTADMCEAARGVPEPVKLYPPHFHLIWDAMLGASPKGRVAAAPQPQPAGVPQQARVGDAPRIDPMQDPMRPTYAKLGPGDEHPAEEVLRKLACWLGVGGYNAPTVDAEEFHKKIVWGVEWLLKTSEKFAASPVAPAAQPSIRAALEAPGCERLRDFYAVGPVQRAAVEAFASAIGGVRVDGDCRACGGSGCKHCDARGVNPSRGVEREGYRQRFPDPGFNRWLDESISDAGHTVYDTIEEVADAWAGWGAREHYGAAGVKTVDGGQR